MGLFDTLKKKATNEFSNPNSHLNRFVRKTFGSNTTTYTRPASKPTSTYKKPVTSKKLPYNPGGDRTGAGIVTKTKK